MANEELQRKLQQEKERNRALRFKSGQIFLQTLEKGSLLKKPGQKKGEGEYYLADDESLMWLLQRLQQIGEPGLQQRMMNVGEPDGSIRTSQFASMLTQIGATGPQVLALQRVAGFFDGGELLQRLKIADVMVRIQERAAKRQRLEVEVLETLA